ncbi:MAG: 30S ribosomal protein S4 [Candidatus Marsarchaeota archaeon]|jgi:small subunit ribosomal protein S4|nr:30S ribosomal protein S4 [Candidatus Marsarchaeota archaeon]MCL5418351.1 30S ribosomal protein S4 [Candidatus Marsarchaeota archaeon]
MGAPRRNRKQYEKPGDIRNLERIKTDHGLVEQYGLKNMKELWKTQTEISRLRGNVREMLSGNVKYKSMEDNIMARLKKLGIANDSTTLDNLLDLSESAMLERRLQTIVFRKGLARSMKQARQLIVHGYIAINGRRVNRPGFIVDSEAEKHIGYYKPIDIMPPAKPSAEQQGAQQEQHEEQAASEASTEVEAAKGEEAQEAAEQGAASQEGNESS